MTAVQIEMGRNPVLTGTTTGAHTDDGRPIVTLDVNATIGNISTTELSVGVNGAAIPGHSTLIGWDDGSGNLQPVSATNPLPTTATLNTGDIEIGAVEIKDATSSNRVTVDASGRMAVDPSGVTSPVSVATLPLPTGASTSANQTTAISSLGNITTALTGNLKVVGPTASGSSLTAAPVTVGGRAATALPAPVTDGQVVDRTLDKYGRTVVSVGLRENIGNQYTTIANTNETTIVTAVASNFLDINSLTITSDTDTIVTIRDDTAGTIKDRIAVKAGTTAGFVSSASPKLVQAVVNKPWTAQQTGAGNISVSVTYRKAGA